MINIAQQDLQRLMELFGGSHWTSAQLEWVLRMSEGNLDRACNRILQHGSKDPGLLMHQLGVPTEGPTQPTPARTPTHSHQQGSIDWCWKETPSQMYHHAAHQIVGDPSECWVLFSPYEAQELEISYQLQEETCELSSGHHSNGTDRYRIDFRTMQQTDLRTGFQRPILRKENGVNEIPKRPIGAAAQTSSVAAASPMPVAAPIFSGTTPMTTNTPIFAPRVSPPNIATNSTRAPIIQHAPAAPAYPEMPPYPNQQQQIPRPLQQHQQQLPQPFPWFIANQAFIGDITKGQLQFQVGSQVFVLPTPETNGWRMGRVHHQQGWFPAPFLPTSNHAQPSHQAPMPSAQHTPTQAKSQTSTADILKLYDLSKASMGQSPVQASMKFQENVTTSNHHLQHPQPLSPQRIPGYTSQSAAVSPTGVGATRQSASFPLDPPICSTSTPSATGSPESGMDMQGKTKNDEEQKQNEALSDLEQEIHELKQQRSSLESKVLTELITRICCRLDGIDVGGSMTLRNRRKSLIQQAETLEIMHGGNVSAEGQVEAKNMLATVTASNSMSTQVTYENNRPSVIEGSSLSGGHKNSPMMASKSPKITSSDILNLYSISQLPASIETAQPHQADLLDIHGPSPQASPRVEMSTFRDLASVEHNSPTYAQQLSSNRVVAKYSFAGDPSQQQLSFPAGAFLSVLKENTICASGWTHGKYNGQKGWFPTAYVVQAQPQQAQQATQDSPQNIDGLHSLGQISMLTPTAPMSLASPPPIPPLEASEADIAGSDLDVTQTSKSPATIAKSRRKSKRPSKNRTISKASQSKDEENLPQIYPLSDGLSGPTSPDESESNDFGDFGEIMGGNAVNNNLWTMAPDSAAAGSAAEEIPEPTLNKKHTTRRKKSSPKKKVDSSTSDANAPKAKKKTRKKEKRSDSACHPSEESGINKRAKEEKKRGKKSPTCGRQ